VLVVRSIKVSAGSVNAADESGVKLIIRAGSGVDNIEVGAATGHGIAVANCPGMNSIAVAELAFGLLLACDRRIPDQTAALRAGQWNKKEFAKARGLKGTTLGVVGCGNIGRAVIRRAIAFDMHVVAWSRGITKEHARDLGADWGGEDTPALLDLAAKCDSITIHLPLAGDTRGLIGKAFFDRMKPGAIIVNTSRGGVIDEAALRDAIASKGIKAGLDVFENQPGGTSASEWKSPTAMTPGVYGTHHAGASTAQAQDAIAKEVVRMVEMYQSRGVVENRVN
jgi:D-3-phosphoglycerate dehydrogenase